METNKLIALYLEDDVQIGKFVTKLLNDSDINTTWVQDVYKAMVNIDVSEIGKLPLDVIITDNWDEQPGPHRFVKKIRQLPDSKTIRGGLRIKYLPIVIFSATAKGDPEIKDIDPEIPIIEKVDNEWKKNILNAIDNVVRKYREELLSQLHNVGFCLRWEAGRCKLYKTYALGKHSGFETKLIDASNSSNFNQIASSYYRLFLIEDRLWSAQRGVSEFEELLNRPSTTERDFHEFFRLHPEFLYQQACIEHWPEPVLKNTEGKIYKPDFILKSTFLPNRPWSWQIVDLKRSGVPLLVNQSFHTCMSHHVHKVVQQLRDYLDFFQDPRNHDLVVKKFGSSISNPKLVAVIGRLPDEEYIDEYSRLKSRILDVSIMTYDEVLEDRRWKVERWSQIVGGFKDI